MTYHSTAANALGTILILLFCGLALMGCTTPDPVRAAIEASHGAGQPASLYPVPAGWEARR